MLYLSEIINRPLCDRQGTRMARLDDVVVLLPDEGAPEPAWPRLHGLVARTERGGAGFFVPLARIGALGAGRIVLQSPEVALERFQPRPGELALRRNLWDHRIINCLTRQIRRVNDVVLGLPDELDRPQPVPADGYPPADLVLLGADIGATGLLRRLSLYRPLRGLVERRQRTDLLAWDELELVPAGVPAGGPQRPHLSEMHPVDIAHLTESVSTQEAAGLIAGLDDETAAEVMEELPADRQLDIVEYLPDERAADILEEMDPDDATDLLGDLPDARTAALLAEMEPEAVTSVRTLLRYPDDTAGGMMTTEFVSVAKDLTAAEVITRLREKAEKPQLIYYVYVTESPRDRRLVGVFSLRDLLVAEPATPVTEFMDRDFLYVEPHDADHEVARKMAEYNLLALPVLDREGRMMGLVTVDDALDVLLPSGWQRRLPRIFS